MPQIHFRYGTDDNKQCAVIITSGDDWHALCREAAWGNEDADELSSNLRIDSGQGLYSRGVVDCSFGDTPMLFRLLEGTILTRDRKNGLGFGLLKGAEMTWDTATEEMCVTSGHVICIDTSNTLRLGELGEYRYSDVKISLLSADNAPAVSSLCAFYAFVLDFQNDDRDAVESEYASEYQGKKIVYILRLERDRKGTVILSANPANQMRSESV